VAQRAPCDLTTVGKFLFDNGYALALQRHSVHLDYLNEVLARLRTTGVLDKLKQRWWQERSECSPAGGHRKQFHVHNSLVYSQQYSSSNKRPPSCDIIGLLFNYLFVVTVHKFEGKYDLISFFHVFLIFAILYV